MLLIVLNTQVMLHFLEGTKYRCNNRRGKTKQNDI
jgi:hypothetical protein